METNGVNINSMHKTFNKINNYNYSLCLDKGAGASRNCTRRLLICWVDGSIISAYNASVSSVNRLNKIIIRNAGVNKKSTWSPVFDSWWPLLALTGRACVPMQLPCTCTRDETNDSWPLIDCRSSSSWRTCTGAMRRSEWWIYSVNAPAGADRDCRHY